MDSNENKKNPPDNARDQDRDLPGYPHYPPEEDIMNPQSGFKKIHADEELANSRNLSSRIVGNRTGSGDASIDAGRNDDSEVRIVRGTEADVTKEDIEMLGAKDGDQDLGEDELILPASRVDEMDNEDDLDVPGSDLDDENEDLGEEDEENNYYSLGGDNHENLEEDQS